MGNQNVMIDTSIIIDHLRKKNKKKSILFKIVDLYNFHLSIIVEFELFAGATPQLYSYTFCTENRQNQKIRTEFH